MLRNHIKKAILASNVVVHLAATNAFAQTAQVQGCHKRDTIRCADIVIKEYLAKALPYTSNIRVSPEPLGPFLGLLDFVSPMGSEEKPLLSYYIVQGSGIQYPSFMTVVNQCVDNQNVCTMTDPSRICKDARVHYIQDAFGTSLLEIIGEADCVTCWD